MGNVSLGLWAGFFALVLTMLAIDLGVSRRRAGAMSLRTAALWTAIWIGMALLFNLGIYFWRGAEPALEFFTAYLIEKALSVDNLFVFVLIFSLFGVPALYQRRVLFWGVLGALIMRGIFIGAGAALLHRFNWLMYVFGAFLIFTAFKLALGGETEIKPERNPLIRLFRKVMPVTEHFEGERFFVRHAGVLMATPLFLVLLVVESTDLVFAVDSIPAVLAVTQDPFLVYTSNVFAILGLRALYFLLAGAMTKFHYLKLGLSAILGFVGVKMLIAGVFKIPVGLSLGVIAGILVIAVVASLVRARRLGAAAEHVRPRNARGLPMPMEDTMHFDLSQIIQTVGYIGLFAIVFAESGLFFGFFLPGDSLLLTAGLLASQGKLEIAVLLVILPVAAILGDGVGYWFGKRAGPRIFNLDESLLFRRKNLLAARAFYNRHGGKTIMLARFMPFIRTFAPIVAGAVEMPYRRFLTFNVTGGLLWGVGVTLTGYFLGQAIPDIDRYFLAVVGVVIVVSALPAMAHLIKEYGPALRRLAGERLGLGVGRRDLAPVPVEDEPE